MKKPKKLEKEEKSKKRKPRSKFRPSFKERCVYSFAKSVEAMAEIRGLILDEEGDQALLGMTYISCYKSLSHAIEMLCKATLVQRSQYLVLEDLKYFDDLFPKEEVLLNSNTCGARVALARSSKIFRLDVQNEEVGGLERIINSRNKCEHNEFFIKDFKVEIQYLAFGFQVVEKIYNGQFREGDLVDEASRYSDEDLKDIFDKTVSENSEHFKKLAAFVEKEKNKGAKFTVCWNCLYLFGQLSSDSKSYKCLWCNDERVEASCVEKNCKNTVWLPKDNSPVKCTYHSNPLNMSMISGEFLPSVFNPGELSPESLEMLRNASGSSTLGITAASRHATEFGRINDGGNSVG